MIKITDKKFFNYSFFSVIFMYFLILPDSFGETQPTFIILFSILSFLLIGFKLKDLYEYKEIIFTFIILTVYFLFQILFSEVNFISYIKIIAGPILYILMLNKVEYLNPKYVEMCITILFSVFVIQLLKLPFIYNILDFTYDIFFNRTLIEVGSIRGMCILTPEPSYFAYFSILLLYAIDYLEIRDNYKHKKIYKIMIFIMSLFTKSSIVYFLLIIYLLQFCSLRYFKIICYCIIAFFIFYFFAKDILSNNRFIDVISIIFSDNENFIDNLIYADESVSFRLVSNLIYMKSILLYPFGMGIGTLSLKWLEIASSLNIYIPNNYAFSTYIVNNVPLFAQAYLPNLVGAIGVFALPLFFYIFRVLLSSNKRINSFRFSLWLVLFFLLILFQSNFLNPVIWILIGFLKKIEVK